MYHAVEPGSVPATTHGAFRYPIARLLGLVGLAAIPLCPALAQAQDVSKPATLQIFEARWDTVEKRSIDMFYAGYGAIWLPPPMRADSGDQSVGYDVYDRFDLGDENRATGYGTQTGLQTTVNQAHNAGVSVYTDLILNHSGFTELGQTDGSGNSFEDAGGYPGFAITLPGDIDGDYHGAFEGGDVNGRLSGLIDIAQEKTHAFIRQPVAAGDPNNIPAGTIPAFNRIANVPTASNAQFYPDQGIPGTSIDVDPGAGEFLVTRYNFNTSNPMAGDAVVETAEQLLMRNAQWMVQVIGVDGFRIDAAKHFPESTLDMLDQAVFRASTQTQHDGSIKPIYSFSEVLDGNTSNVQPFINRGLSNNNAIDASDNQVQGNRDALDFPLFFEMRNNLTGVSGNNNWHGIRNASQDNADDGLRNGSQGVSFVGSHDNLDGGFPFLENVAYAYTLMRPGEAIVYHNAKEFGEGRAFPNDGRDDALGGYGSDTITTLVNLRNTHGRGNFHERWVDDAFNPNGFSNIYIYERGNAAIVALNSKIEPGEQTRNGVQTEFAPGTHLVELTGNADDLSIDPNDDIPNTIVVNASGQVNITMPNNKSDNGNLHGKGYVIYGLATPDAAISIPEKDSTNTGAGSNATGAGTLVGDVDIINTSTFTVRVDTSAVTLPDSFRDFDADGDFAVIKIDEGMDLNGNGVVDYTTPGSVVYGFENFQTTNTPGYINDGLGTNIGTGTGLYEQTIDATQLSEGYHFITGRTFRHRDDGGPAIFDDQKRVVYVDLLAPDSEVFSLELNGGGTGNMDLLMRSVDQTASAVFVYFDLPANATEAEILDVDPSLNTTLKIDRDLFRREFLNVKDGNHVITLLTVEQTGSFNIQRFAGLNTTGANGAGLGDLDSDDAFTPADMTAVPGGFEDILYSQNDKFHAAADVNADGLVDNRDLFSLEAELIAGSASQPTLGAYAQVLLGRGDVNEDSLTNADDIDFVYAQFGSTAWLVDLDVTGNTDGDDVNTLVQTILGTDFGDLNLDGSVTGTDLATLDANLGLTGLGWAGGDIDGSGLIDAADRALLMANLSAILGDLNSDGFVGVEDLNIVLGNWNQTVTAGDLLTGDPTGDGFVGIEDLNTVLGNWNAGTPPTSNVNIPEPATIALLSLGLVLTHRRR
jgi:alpha amylase-like protein/dockerin type I repeat protein